MSKQVRLGDHTTKIGSGQTPLGGWSSYAQSGIPLIRSQNVMMGSFSEKGLVYISDSVDKLMRGSRVCPGDVLLNITGASIGRVCVVPDRICPANVNQHVCIIRCDESINPEYVAAILASPRFQAFIWGSQAGGTRQALTKQMIEEFLIPWLPIEMQRQIASHLKSQLAELEKIRQASVVQLNEVARLADSLVFDSIERSETTKRSLGDILIEIKSGIGKTWSEYPVLGATRAGLAPAKEPPGKLAEKYKPAFPGTVFYNPMRILIGSIAFVDEEDTPGITSPDYVVLHGKGGIVDSRWFYFWLRSPIGEECIGSLARGAVRERMLFSRLAEGEIHLPSFTAQRQASKALMGLKHMRDKLKLQLDEINLLSQKLLSKTFEN